MIWIHSETMYLLFFLKEWKSGGGNGKGGDNCGGNKWMVGGTVRKPLAASKYYKKCPIKFVL